MKLSMEPIRYRPGEAIRWLHTGAESSRKVAKDKRSSITHPDEARTFGQSVRTAAGALLEMGRGAMADLAHRQAEAIEYVLHDDSFEIIKGSNITVVPFEKVRRIEQHGDRTTLVLQDKRFSVKPYAYITAGRLKVPIGWERNGLEVPYELLIDELSARAGMDIQDM